MKTCEDCTHPSYECARRNRNPSCARKTRPAYRKRLKEGWNVLLRGLIRQKNNRRKHETTEKSKSK